ncbi:MAG: site-specific DNA-methyltransferase [Candidatus Gastranaerophilales bacterium]|nr:site-specific DNA-methyltransferase [Candidatus Gastranaerophilales bacterium]
MTEERKGFYFELLDLLEQDPEKRFYADNGKDLLRNKIYECAMKMDKDLIKLLLSNDRMKEKFFTDIDGTLVFDKTAFGWAINNKAFLQDSYTRFKNTIGLIDSKEQFIFSKNDVVLSFPYKDCVLEGGQTKEDQKREEIYYNELLAPDDIDRLLAPKVFTNMKRYTKDGEESLTKFKDSDNLLIKGNNLLALSSLLKRYEGCVKCIYIDPPYNTGGDSFNYNDSFNHSSWLTFMRNRLVLARKLLNEKGTLFISLDDKEAHYCKILADEIFGRENFIADICHKARGSISNDKIISSNHNHILFYAKNERLIFAEKESYGISKDLSTFTEKDDNGYYKLVPVDGPGGANKGNPYYEFCGITNYWRFSQKTMQEMYENGLIVKKGNSLQQKYYKSKAEQQRQTITTWWDEGYLTSSATSQLKKVMGEDCFKNPKNESLIELILEFATKENDLVLDYHLGSGTTCVVAHKMKRKYIGIEQLEYGKNSPKHRLQKVIQNNDNDLISKYHNWQGGGSFVYCELKELNHKYINQIQDADDSKLNELYQEIINSEFISYKADINKLKESDKDYQELDIEEKRRFLIEILDKNLLYVNYCDMEDEELAVTDEEKAFARSFYGEE